MKRRFERSRIRSRVVQAADIRVEATRDSPERLHLVLPKAHKQIAPTHWAFDRLASIVVAPAAYMRQLPASLAGINLQYGRTRARGMTRPTPIPDTITVRVPFHVVKRGGRKEMVLPEGAAQPRKADNTLVKAMARAFRWKRMLESGDFATIAELAEREGIAPSYMTRVLRLTLLAPDIVEAILEKKTAPSMTLVRMIEPRPPEWTSQVTHFGWGTTKTLQHRS